jgi:hypothetical protein
MNLSDKKKLIDTLESTKKILEQLAKEKVLDAAQKIEELKKKVQNDKGV